VVENVPTKPRARTMALDPKSHKVYLVTAEFRPAPAATPEQPRPRPPMVPNTFTVLVFENRLIAGSQRTYRRVHSLAGFIFGCTHFGAEGFSCSSDCGFCRCLIRSLRFCMASRLASRFLCMVSSCICHNSMLPSGSLGALVLYLRRIRSHLFERGAMRSTLARFSLKALLSPLARVHQLLQEGTLRGINLPDDFFVHRNLAMSGSS